MTLLSKYGDHSHEGHEGSADVLNVRGKKEKRYINIRREIQFGVRSCSPVTTSGADSIELTTHQSITKPVQLLKMSVSRVNEDGLSSFSSYSFVLVIVICS